MPELAGIAETDGLAVLDDVGNDEDLRMPWEQELLQHMDLQLTEAPAEGDLLRRGDALLAEHQHMVVRCARWIRRKSSAAGAAEVEAEHLGAERGIEGTDLGERRARWRRKETDIADSPRKPGHAGHEIPARGGMDSVRRADWSAGTRESLIYWNRKINLNTLKNINMLLGTVRRSL